MYGLGRGWWWRPFYETLLQHRFPRTQCNKHLFSTVMKILYRWLGASQISSLLESMQEARDIHLPELALLKPMCWERGPWRQGLSLFLLWFLFIFLTLKLLIYLFWPEFGILVPGRGIKPAPPAAEVQSFNHWTARQAPLLWFLFFIYLLLFFFTF